LQKRATRLLCNAPFGTPTKPLFDYLGILRFECINKLLIGIFMFKLHFNLMLSSAGHWFCKHSEIHDHNTRSWNRYHQQSVRTTKGLYSIRISGPLFWNNLPLKLTGVSIIYLFKKKLKTFLLNSIAWMYNVAFVCMYTVVPFHFGIFFNILYW